MVQFAFVIPAESKDKSQRHHWVRYINDALKMVSGVFDSAWIVDHLMFDDTDVLESFTSLSYFAALHPELKFGHAVLCQSFRNPALLAKMAANLQFLSDGRYILGLGAGWHEGEYRAYGYEFPSDGVRVAQLEETVQIVKALWAAEVANFEGKYYQIRDARLEPKPNPMPPLMIGAFGPKMLRLTAKYADWWNVSSTSLKQYQQKNEQLKRECEAIGRDSSEIKRSWIGGCACARTETEALVLTEGRWNYDDEDDFGFVGTPEQIIAQLEAFIEQGMDYFILDTGKIGDMKSLELIVREVVPSIMSATQ